MDDDGVRRYFRTTIEVVYDYSMYLRDSDDPEQALKDHIEGEGFQHFLKDQASGLEPEDFEVKEIKEYEQHKSR